MGAAHGTISNSPLVLPGLEKGKAAQLERRIERHVNLWHGAEERGCGASTKTPDKIGNLQFFPNLKPLQNHLLMGIMQQCLFL